MKIYTAQDGNLKQHTEEQILEIGGEVEYNGVFFIKAPNDGKPHASLFGIEVIPKNR